MAVSLPCPSLSPCVWPPSTLFEGIDGDWSTFTLNVGDSGSDGQDAARGQNFRVLISTSASATFIPSVDDRGLCSDRNGSDATNCYDSRGIGKYNSAQSNGFKPQEAAGWTGLESFPFTLETSDVDYGTSLSAFWGTVNVGLGDAAAVSPIIANQLVGLTSTADFWLGIFGLSSVPMNIRDVAYPTWLKANFDADGHKDNTPSFSYAYTAGSYFENGGKGVLGSLTLGGYDAARYDTDKAVQVSLPGGSAGEDPTLQVGVPAIQISTGPQSTPETISAGAFTANIDSTLPFLWLPSAICEAFIRRYNLTLNDDDLYAVDEDFLKEHGGDTLTVQIANNQNSREVANIAMPIQALYQSASPPFANTTRHYLAVRKAPKQTFVLGRAFLQYAYIIVDYQRRNFTVAQAIIHDPMPQSDIQPIVSEENIAHVSPINKGSDSLSGGAIAGIVVGIAFLFLAIAFGWYFWNQQKKKKAAAGHRAPPMSEKDGHAIDYPGSPPPGYADRKNRESANTYASNELEDSSRTTSAQGFYHRASESGTTVTELVGSPPPGTNEKGGDYFKYSNNAEPAPLAELPGDLGLYELAARKPKNRRKRSAGSTGSAGMQSPASERPDPIAEEQHADGEGAGTTRRREGATDEGALYEDGRSAEGVGQGLPATAVTDRFETADSHSHSHPSAAHDGKTS